MIQYNYFYINIRSLDIVGCSAVSVELSVSVAIVWLTVHQWNRVLCLETLYDVTFFSVPASVPKSI